VTDTRHPTLDLQWEPIGEAPFRSDQLHATANVCGLLMHFDAIRVREDGSPFPGSAYSDDAIGAVHDAVGGDEPFETMRIGRSRYIIIATPFCQ